MSEKPKLRFVSFLENVAAVEKNLGIIVRDLSRGDILYLETFGPFSYELTVVDPRERRMTLKCTYGNLPQIPVQLTGSLISYGSSIKEAWLAPGFSPVIFIDGMGEARLAPVKVIHVNGFRVLPVVEGRVN